MISIGGLVVKLAVAIRDLASQMIRPAPGSIPGRCMTVLCLTFEVGPFFCFVCSEDICN